MDAVFGESQCQTRFDVRQILAHCQCGPDQHQYNRGKSVAYLQQGFTEETITAVSRSAQQADITLSQAANAESALKYYPVCSGHQRAQSGDRNCNRTASLGTRDVDRKLIRIRNLSGQTADVAAQTLWPVRDCQCWQSISMP